jgi:putative ABC transport system ATP-binding protein
VSILENSVQLDLISLRGVSKTFAAGGDAFAALEDVDLDFTRGEHVAILGKSGSGKSTLLNILTGIDRPTAGSVVADGVRIDTLDETALARWRGRHVGIVFQFFQLVPTLTVRENVLLAMEFAGAIPRASRTPRADELLAMLDIAPHAHKLPAEISGGEQQRAAIARALANDPPLVVADEPTGNLDSRSAAAVQDLLRRIAGEGRTVIVVTHDETAAQRYARVIHLKDGRVDSDVRSAAQPRALERVR